MSRHGRAYLVLNNGYFVCVSILCLEMAASWDVYGRDDVALLSAIGVAAGIINIYSLSTGSLRFSYHTWKSVIQSLSNKNRY